MEKFRPFSKVREHGFFRYEKSENEKTKRFIQFSVVLIIGLTLGFAVNRYSYDILANLGVAPKVHVLDTSSLQETYSVLKNSYDGEVDDQKLISAANAAMVQAVGDDYTVYMDQKTAEAFNAELSGDIGAGVGVELAMRSNRVVVLRVLADNPALRAGIKPGDVITAVDAQEVSGQALMETVSKIRGTSGTKVMLTVERDGKSLDFVMTRETINNKSVDSYIKDDVGVIRIIRFDNETGELARVAALDLKSKNVKGIIVDLRNNGGGYVEAAKDVAGLWLKDKVVTVEKSGSKVVDKIKTGNNVILEGVKTVVLINGGSASASEILAGALQDYKLATIVGEKSFGKGSVQELFSVSNGSLMKVTIAKWYTPNGKNIDSSGITPDKKVELNDTDYNKGIDNQLEAAIKLI